METGSNLLDRSKTARQKGKVEEMTSYPFGTYSFGWNYWKSTDKAKRQAQAKADVFEAIKWSFGALCLAIVAYAWIVLLFCL